MGRTAAYGPSRRSFDGGYRGIPAIVPAGTADYLTIYTIAAIHSVWVNFSSLEFLASAIEGTAAMTASPRGQSTAGTISPGSTPTDALGSFTPRTSFGFSAAADVHEFRPDEDDPYQSFAAELVADVCFAEDPH
jgi:hypothetical protein